MPSGNAHRPTLAALEKDGPLLGRDPIDTARVADIYADLLTELVPGWEDDPHMEGTPERVARFWAEFLDHSPGKAATAFPVEKADQVVIVRGIETYALCAHHLLPFSATIAIGYMADKTVLGLSKFARLADWAAHRPTSQEALVETIADLIHEATGTRDVAVFATGTHLCMAMRGVRQETATMTTSVLRGMFRSDPSVREEWLALAKG